MLDNHPSSVTPLKGDGQTGRPLFPVKHSDGFSGFTGRAENPLVTFAKKICSHGTRYLELEQYLGNRLNSSIPLRNHVNHKA
jgi:hypothetical protein